MEYLAWKELLPYTDRTDAELVNTRVCFHSGPTTDPRTGEPATRYSSPAGKSMVVTESGEVIEVVDSERAFWNWWSNYTPPQTPFSPPIMTTAVIPSAPLPTPPVTSHPGPPTGSGSSQGPALLYAPDGTVLGYAPVAGSTTAGGTPQNPINCTYTGIVTSVNAPFYTINCSSTGITSSWNAPQNPFPCASTGMTTSMNAPPDPIICYTYGAVSGGSGSADNTSDAPDPGSGITWGTSTSQPPTPSYSTGFSNNPWAFAAEALFGSSTSFTAAVDSALATIVTSGFDPTGAANTAAAPIAYTTTGSGGGSGLDASGWPRGMSELLAVLRDLPSIDPFSGQSGWSTIDSATGVIAGSGGQTEAGFTLTLSPGQAENLKQANPFQLPAGPLVDPVAPLDPLSLPEMRGQGFTNPQQPNQLGQWTSDLLQGSGLPQPLVDWAAKNAAGWTKQFLEAAGNQVGVPLVPFTPADPSVVPSVPGAWGFSPPPPGPDSMINLPLYGPIKSPKEVNFQIFEWKF